MKPGLSLLVAAVMLITSSVSLLAGYYDISDHARAQQEARQRKLPIAWVGGYPESMNESNPDPGSNADLLQMAMATLQDKAVIIFFDGRNMAPVPAIVHAEYHKQDDGPLDGHARWLTPKVVFTNPEVTRVFGRVSHTQMAASRDAEILGVLNAIRSDPTAMDLPKPPPPPPPGTTTLDTDDSTPIYDTPFGKIPLNPALAAFLTDNRDLLIKIGIGLVILLILMRLFRRRT